MRRWTKPSTGAGVCALCLAARALQLRRGVCASAVSLPSRRACVGVPVVCGAVRPVPAVVLVGGATAQLSALAPTARRLRIPPSPRGAERHAAGVADPSTHRMHDPVGAADTPAQCSVRRLTVCSHCSVRVCCCGVLSFGSVSSAGGLSCAEQRGRRTHTDRRARHDTTAIHSTTRTAQRSAAHNTPLRPSTKVTTGATTAASASASAAAAPSVRLLSVVVRPSISSRQRPWLPVQPALASGGSQRQHRARAEGASDGAAGDAGSNDGEGGRGARRASVRQDKPCARAHPGHRPRVVVRVRPGAGSFQGLSSVQLGRVEGPTRSTRRSPLTSPQCGLSAALNRARRTRLEQACSRCRLDSALRTRSAVPALCSLPAVLSRLRSCRELHGRRSTQRPSQFNEEDPATTVARVCAHMCVLLPCSRPQILLRLRRRRRRRPAL